LTIKKRPYNLTERALEMMWVYILDMYTSYIQFKLKRWSFTINFAILLFFILPKISILKRPIADKSEMELKQRTFSFCWKNDHTHRLNWNQNIQQHYNVYTDLDYGNSWSTKYFMFYVCILNLKVQTIDQNHWIWSFYWNNFGDQIIYIFKCFCYF
jgi:hypothetical protein